MHPNLRGISFQCPLKLVEVELRIQVVALRLWATPQRAQA